MDKVNSKTAQRAFQVWPLLVWAANHRQFLTYGDVYKCTGLTAVGVGRALDPIFRYCNYEKLPPLTAIVVSSKTFLPQKGITGTPAEIQVMQKKVFLRDWGEDDAPDFEELAGYIQGGA